LPPLFCRYGGKGQSGQLVQNSSLAPEYGQKALKAEKILNNLIAGQKKALTLTFFIEIFLFI